MADVQALYIEDAAYPELLRRIADPPSPLYCRGNTALLSTFCIGVVGTRLASDYGRQATRDLAGQLAANGVTVVSGLALGIDAIAHQAALDAPGKTIAVLGTGIKNLWPKENERLGKRIIEEGGLVVSEYPGTMPGGKHTFPKRNRIISGLSRGVVVVEANKKSGSLITAACALDQNRDVFAVPGSIYWPRSAGSNLLIQQGARPVMTVSDILESYAIRHVPLPKAPLSTRDPLQQSILALLRTQGPAHLDAVIVATQSDAAHVIAAISILELHNDIRHAGNNIYHATTSPHSHS
ncbi:MAG: DNA-protecting protein DprA [Candidatus Yanofskybacteria bacterium]|nr:DNA-protecting protein DprA [Candidatus Yanofskybacteria bacterium]